jgi:hypothetical protein
MNLTSLSSSNYDALRPYITSGDVLAWRGSSLGAEIVRHWTGDTYSHVGIAWRIAGRVLLLEAASGRGVVAVPLSGSLSPDCYWIRTRADWGPKPAQMALDQLGMGYGWWNDIRVGLGMRPKSGRWECAQYVMSVLAASGLKLDCKATPGGVVESLLKRQ